MSTRLNAALASAVVVAGLGAGGRAMAIETITLVGASIGKDWHFDGLGDRARVTGYRFAYAGVYAFDKGPVITRLLGQAEKPSVVMIKECAAYFPGDLDAYRRAIMSWVDEIRRAGVRPMLVTTAPVAEPAGALGRLKQVAKRVLRRPRASDEIAAFNEWLRDYAQRERIPLFDLEAVLRRSEQQRSLRPEYDSGDGLHLTAAAYGAMDVAFARFLAAPERIAAP